MQIPADAVVKPFENADLGNLLVGRFNENGPNFVAIRTELQESVGDATPYMAILSCWVDNQLFPYLCNPSIETTKVLDLGRDWTIDVSINDTTPNFIGIADTVLIRFGNTFFIKLVGGHFLNLTSGRTIKGPTDWQNVAFWSAFTIHLPQPGFDGLGAEIFRLPQE